MPTGAERAARLAGGGGVATATGRAVETDMDRVVVFVQAEDGIRDVVVTGVQTCALPISKWRKCSGDARIPSSTRSKRKCNDSPMTCDSKRLPGCGTACRHCACTPKSSEWWKVKKPRGMCLQWLPAGTTHAEWCSR